MKETKKVLAALVSCVLILGGTWNPVILRANSVQGENSGFKFEIEDVTTKTGEYLALTDRYGVEIFLEEFDNKVAAYKENQAKQIENLFHEVLTDEEKQKSYDTIFSKVINIDEQTRYKKEFTMQEPSSESNKWWVFILIGLVGVGMIVMITVPRKGRKKNENNVKSYVFQE